MAESFFNKLNMIKVHLEIQHYLCTQKLRWIKAKLKGDSYKHQGLWLSCKQIIATLSEATQGKEAS